jgi:hypothetical protein
VVINFWFFRIHIIAPGCALLQIEWINDWRNIAPLTMSAPAEVLSARLFKPTKFAFVIQGLTLRDFRHSSGDRRSCHVRKALVNVENLRSHILDSHRIKALQVFA